MSQHSIELENLAGFARPYLFLPLSQACVFSNNTVCFMTLMYMYMYMYFYLINRRK